MYSPYPPFGCWRQLKRDRCSLPGIRRTCVLYFAGGTSLLPFLSSYHSLLSSLFRPDTNISGRSPVASKREQICASPVCTLSLGPHSPLSSPAFMHFTAIPIIYYPSRSNKSNQRQRNKQTLVNQETTSLLTGSTPSPSTSNGVCRGRSTSRLCQKAHLVKAFLYGLQVFYSFFIMLLFMTYNVSFGSIISPSMASRNCYLITPCAG